MSQVAGSLTHRLGHYSAFIEAIELVLKQSSSGAPDEELSIPRGADGRLEELQAMFFYVQDPQVASATEVKISESIQGVAEWHSHTTGTITPTAIAGQVRPNK